MAQSQAGCFSFCPKCRVNRVNVDKSGVCISPHNVCLQCLGQDHDPFACLICNRLGKSIIAKREIQRRAWIHSGVFQNRQKAVAYLKSKGLESEIKRSLNISFSSLDSSRDSVNQSQDRILAQGHPVQPSTPAISYGDAVSGTVLPQFPSHTPHPEASSTKDSFSSAFEE